MSLQENGLREGVIPCDEDPNVFLHVLPGRMRNSRWSIIVRRYLAGQLRLQLCDQRLPDRYAPPGHGAIEYQA